MPGTWKQVISSETVLLEPRAETRGRGQITTVHYLLLAVNNINYSVTCLCHKTLVSHCYLLILLSIFLLNISWKLSKHTTFNNHDMQFCTLTACYNNCSIKQTTNLKAVDKRVDEGFKLDFDYGNYGNFK